MPTVQEASLKNDHMPIVAQRGFRWSSDGKPFGFTKVADYQKKDEFCQRPLLTGEMTRGTVELGTFVNVFKV